MINLQWIRLRSPTQYKCMLHRKYIDHARCGWLRNDECIGNTCNTGGGSIFKYSCTLELNNEVFLTDLAELIHYTFICKLYDTLFVISTFSRGVLRNTCLTCLRKIACILLFVILKKKNPQLKLSIHAITYFSQRYRNICLFVLYLAFINSFPVFSANMK